MLRAFLLALLAAGAAAAQPLDLQRRIDPFPVLDADGTAYPYAFFGGLNTPKPQLADLDGDADLDLFILEERGRLIHYENTGDFDLAWRSDRALGLDPGTWFRFGDLDGDGDLDLIAQKFSGSVRYFRNEGTPAEPQLVLAADPLTDTAGTPLMAEDPNVPALADVDGDGDLDLFMGQADSGLIRFYRHAGVEDGLPRFEFVTHRYQDIVIYEANPTCGRGTLHGQNALTFSDVDDDGDLDLFWGDFFTPSLYFFENRGTPQNAAFELVSEQYPLDDPLTSGGYNAATFGDVDRDGAPDLVIGIVGGFCSSTANLTENLYLLRNHGTPASPDFDEETSRLIRGIDVGQASYPAFADLDGDGDLDLVVGSAFNPEVGRGSLVRFENVGSATGPRFRLAEPDFLQLEIDFSAHYAPAFADLDGDGDDDLVVGTFNGRLAYLRNDFGTLGLAEEGLGGLDVGSLATPAFGDLDGDGDLDAVVGEFGGTLNLVRNEGTPQDAQLVLEDDAFLGLDVGRYSAPQLVDVDGDGDLDLLVGTEDRDVLFFRNTGTPQAPQFAEEPFEAVFRMNAAPVLADLDGDGDLDLVSGSQGGGLLYFENRAVTSSAADPAAPAGRARIESFPNPFGDATTLRVTGGHPEGMTLALFDLLGRELRRWGVEPGEAAFAVAWDGTTAAGAEAPSGVYLARLTAGDRLLATETLTRAR